MEEIGKAFAAEHYAWTEKANGRSDTDFEREWIAWLLSDHRGKQLAFLRESMSIGTSAKYFDVVHKHLEVRKQNSIYAGLSVPSKDRPRTDGKMIYPMQFTRKQADAQLKMVHGFILEHLDGIEAGSIEMDLEAFNRILTPVLRRRLEQAYNSAVGPKTQGLRRPIIA
jgi:hypothetical protein